MAGRRPRGSGSVTRLTTGRWRARIRHQGRDWTAVRRTRREALEALDELRRRAGLATADHKLTVARHLATWVDRVDVADSTRVSYRRHVSLRLVPYLGHHLVADLDGPTITAALHDMGRDHTASNVRKAAAVLSSALSDAVRWGLLDRNPLIGPAVQLPRHTPRPPQPLTVDQALTIVADTTDPWHALWVLLLVCGVRYGEAAALTWSMVDLDAEVLHIPGTKTASAARTIPLVDVVGVALLAHQDRQQTMRRAAGRRWHDLDLVFTRERPPGMPLSHTTVYRAWHAACRRAGAPEVHLHDARHTTGSLLAALGVDPAVRMALLGHTTMAMTAHYSRQHAAAVRDALDRLSAALGG